MPLGSADTAELFWDKHYRPRQGGGERRHGARANPLLVEIVTTFRPGPPLHLRPHPAPARTALDLGSGGGGDAIWLAQQGWRVTAVDISTAAVEQLLEDARAIGLGPQIVAEQHDLSRSFPSGEFDLVSAQYFQSPFDLPRSQILRTAATALRPGGLLLIVDHGSTAPWSWNQDPDAHFPPPTELAASLDLDPEQWAVLRADQPQRQATGPSGETAAVTDHVLLIQRTTLGNME